MTKIRCAIYTRKSSEEGLEQGFNSLDAQREACAAYVLSQASEGWNLLPDIYDDGGISGGTLERPALQRLLADVAAGKIDIIVVYKVDRLTRSLLDFAKLVEAFDKASTSFVSITQSFNTTTSMGRLTLNMLLSFAQFEREVTAERIRDKISASKARGMWMGGTPPLGYRPDGRTLAIVDKHAVIVRDIYRRYLDLGNVRHLTEQLAAEGIDTPQRTSGTGRGFGGCRFSRGQLYLILRNPIYVGDIPHRGKIHKGQHPAIIEREIWDRVQALMTSHVQGERKTRSPHASVLAGLIVDSADEPMLATHACKGKIRYRYYVSRSLQHGDTDGKVSGVRLPAREIEAVVAEQVAQFFDDPLLIASRLLLTITPTLLPRISEHCAAIAPQLRSRTRGPLRDIVTQVRALEDRLEIDLAIHRIAEMLECALAGEIVPVHTISIAIRLTRTGRAIRLVQGDGSLGRQDGADPALVKLLIKARKWWSTLAEGELDISTLAIQEGVTASWMTRIVRLAFLAPDVVDAILDGRQRAHVEAKTLCQTDTVPASWEKQTEQLLPTNVSR